MRRNPSKMADDDKLDTHKHRRRKGGSPEWSEMCIGFWSKTYKEISDKENEEERRCRGISILHLNKFASASKVKNIPTAGIEIVIREGDNVSASRNLHPFLGIFVDEKNADRKTRDTESNQDKQAGGDKLKDHSDELTPKILGQVVESWGKRCHNIGKRLVKYYNDPSSSGEILTDAKRSISGGYDTTVRILSYCHPKDKAKQISSFISESLKNVSKWWKE